MDIKHALKPGSRVFLIANNPRLSATVLHNLGISDDDLVVQFNKCIHALSPSLKRGMKFYAFSGRESGLAWGFDDDGKPLPIVGQSISEAMADSTMVGALFSPELPPHVQLDQAWTVHVLSNTAPDYPRSMFPSIGFVTYRFFTKILSDADCPQFLIYAVGFAGMDNKDGRVWHDFRYEQWYLARAQMQSAHTILVDAEKGLQGMFWGDRAPHERLGDSLQEHSSATYVQAPAAKGSTPIAVQWIEKNCIEQELPKLSQRHDIALLLKPGGIGVELGVAEGRFSEKILERSGLSHLYSIDMYAGDRGHDIDQYKSAFKRLERFRDKNSLLKLRFDEAIDLFPDEFFDFIYVDGYAHTGEEGGRTFHEWWPKLKSGGVFAGDDYSSAWPLVQKAVDSFIAEKEVPFYVINCASSSDDWASQFPTWFTFKP